VINPGNYWPADSSTGEMLFLIFGLPILMLNFWAWTAPEIIEGLFFFSRPTNPAHVICTYCSANKDRAEGFLPASSRYRSERITKVKDIASQANQRFCILSGEFGLLESEQPIPWYDHRLTLEEIPSLVEKLAAQITEKKIKRMDYYSRSIEVDPYTAPYTSSIEAACRKAGVTLQKHILE